MAITLSVITLKTVFVLLLQVTCGLKLLFHRTGQTVAEESKNLPRTVSFFLIQPAAGDSEKGINQGKDVVTGRKRQTQTVIVLHPKCCLCI